MRGIFSRRGAARLIVMGGLIVRGSAARAQSTAELYEKAKAEGALVFYSGGPAAPHEARAKLFMQQFPGITVSVTGGFSNVLNADIEKQMSAGAMTVDMAFFQTVQDFVAWKSRDKLLAFKPEGFDNIYPNLRDPDGTSMALSINALTYAYNTNKLAAADAPRSALDFLKPVFAGNVITCYPADDDATLYLYSLIVKKYGWIGWTSTWRTSRTSSRAISMWRAASLPAPPSRLSMHRLRSGHSSATASWTSSGRRSTIRRCSRSPAEFSKARRIRMRRSSISPGFWPRNSRPMWAHSPCGMMSPRPPASSL
jgi:hypothetical protein